MPIIIAANTPEVTPKPLSNSFTTSLWHCLEDTTNMEASFNQVNLVGSLALYQNRRDSALGLSYVTSKTRGLLWYYNILQAQIYKDYLRASASRNALMEIRNRLKRIKREARRAPIERKRELLIEAMKLEELANQWLT